MGLGDTTKRGALIWDFLATFVASRSMFLSIYRRYERRVLRQARGMGVPRAELKLPPQELWKLFHLPRLEHLREVRLKPLRELAREIFGDAGDDGLMDAYCGHIYHEISILSEEHRSVGRFVRHHDPRRYRSLFEEVSGYYPLRLNRVLRFFRAAMKRLDELLPRWSRERVVVRSAYLFGESLARRAYHEDVDALYARMYPNGGVIRGYLEAGRSFHESGFENSARRALAQAMEAWETEDEEADQRHPGRRVAMEEVRELMARLVPVGRRHAEVMREEPPR
ncbi:MAG: hypothetical protein QNJ90_02360 [Planctomycetota bacterium]|nr:hypothetical protein [Planctomycetota bacterium]